MLDVRRMRVLREVAQRGSFSAAAEALSFTQSAVSQQIAALEREAGTVLVERSARGVRLTEAGEAVVRHTDAILARLAEAEAEFEAIAGLRGGRLRLAAFESAGSTLMPLAIAAFRERHPAVELSMTLTEPEDSLPQLRAGELDLAIVFEHAFEPARTPEDVELVALFDDPPRALLPAGHRRAGAAGVGARDLARDTWIRAHHGSAARLVDHVLRGAGLAPPVLAAGHGDEPVEAQAFVAAGRGVTVAHALNVLIAPAQIAAVPLAGGPVRHIQAAIMREQRAPLPRAALDALVEVGRRRRRA